MRFGFREGKGTDQAISKLTSSIHNALDENKKCATIYLDLEKAFDTDHNIFFTILRSGN